MTDFRLNEPNDYKIFCGWLVSSSLDELLEIVTLTTAKRNICEKHTQPVLSIMLGSLASGDTFVASGDTFEDLKFINAISPQYIGIIMLETCLLLGRQMITE